MKFEELKVGMILYDKSTSNIRTINDINKEEKILHTTFFLSVLGELLEDNIKFNAWDNESANHHVRAKSVHFRQIIKTFFTSRERYH